MRWAILICAAFWALTASLIVRACSDADGQASYIAPPPARFIQERQSAFVMFMPPEEIPAQCGPSWALACASVGGAQVWMPHPCAYPNDWYARLLCHELAHNAGWSEGHER
jgi:hypothetical protein